MKLEFLHVFLQLPVLGIFDPYPCHSLRRGDSLQAPVLLKNKIRVHRNMDGWMAQLWMGGHDLKNGIGPDITS